MRFALSNFAALLLTFVLWDACWHCEGTGFDPFPVRWKNVGRLRVPIFDDCPCPQCGGLRIAPPIDPDAEIAL